MAYQKSSARCNFEKNCNDLCRVLKSAHVGGGALNLKEYVTAAIIFLAHAELENYVEDSFSCYARAIQLQGIKGSSLPITLQSHLFISKANIKTHLGKLISGGQEKQFLEAISNGLQGSAGDIIRGLPIGISLTGEDIYGTQKYPSVKNLEKIFNRIGINNLFDQLSSSLKQDSSALLESLGGLRTQLAHTAVLPGIAYKDVLDRIVDTKRFVGAMDRLLFKNMSSNFGAKSWSDHMC